MDLPKSLRKRGTPRLRICQACDRKELVRSDNHSKQCRPCAGRRTGFQVKEKRSGNKFHARCEQCGKDFLTTSSAIKSRRRHYCSPTCLTENRWTSRKCKFCGADFKVRRSALSGRTNASGNFCSRPCYNNYLCSTERTNGRGSRWKKVRQEALKRAPFCAICGTLQRLDVHHITPYRLTHDNKQTNLIPLCKKHHKMVETIHHDLGPILNDEVVSYWWFRTTLDELQAINRHRLLQLWKDVRATTIA